MSKKNKNKETHHFNNHEASYMYEDVCDIVIPLIEMCGCDWFKSHHVV